MVFLLAVFLGLQVVFTTSNVIPDRLPFPCPKSFPNYNECMSQFLSKMGLHALKGIRELNIPSFNPLYIPVYSVNRTISEMASAAGILRNTKLFGFESMALKSFKFNPNTMRGEIDLFMPYLRVTTEYEGSLKLLTPFSLTSSGYGKVNAASISLHMKFTLKPIERLGVKYYTLDDYKVKIDIGDARVKAVAKNPNEQIIAQFFTNFINGNTKRSIDEFQVLLDESAESFSKPIFERFLNTIPADELIPE